MIRLLTLAALALACAVAPALAEIAAATTDVVVPWSTWLDNTLVTVAAVSVPVVSGFIIKGINQVAPWARLFLSQKRVETLVQNGMNYGINAVQGATKGGVLTVPMGSAVIAKAVQYQLDNGPKKVIDAAGGAEGLAQKVFRSLNLEDGASAANTLAPVLDTIPRK